MTIAQALALAGHLVAGVLEAINAGRQNVTDEAVDAAIAEITPSDERLTAAIERARAREAGDDSA